MLYSEVNGLYKRVVDTPMPWIGEVGLFMSMTDFKSAVANINRYRLKL